MNVLTVDEKTCTQCGLCAVDCPGGIIVYREKSYPRLLPNAETVCIRCGHCVAICPSGSLTHIDVPLEQCPEVDGKIRVDLPHCERLIKSRRSIRWYKDKPVPREVTEKIIDIARYAPTGHNDQAVQWLVIDTGEKIQQLEKIGADWMRDAISRDKWMAATFPNILKRIDAGYHFFLRDAPVLVVAYSGEGMVIRNTDCIIALSYFDLAAKSAGLGCCWAGFFMMAANSFPALKEALSLPEAHRIYGALMVGYPKYKYRRIPLRKPPHITWL
jgi:nitroreductase/formate hydrogenlyase subunit 6/NADH:ubiquinone oxidoreductase subunit I